MTRDARFSLLTILGNGDSKTLNPLLMSTMASDAHYVLIPPSTAPQNATQSCGPLWVFVGICVKCVKQRTRVTKRHTIIRYFVGICVICAKTWDENKKPHQSAHGSQNATQSYGTLWVFFLFVWKANFLRHPKTSISVIGKGMRESHSTMNKWQNTCSTRRPCIWCLRLSWFG